MNSIVIKTKLESLRKCLDRIESKKPETLDDLLEDIDVQDIIALNLERSVQLCVDIANHILSTLDDAPAMSMAESFESGKIGFIFLFSFVLILSLVLSYILYTYYELPLMKFLKKYVII